MSTYDTILQTIIETAEKREPGPLYPRLARAIALELEPLHAALEFHRGLVDDVGASCERAEAERDQLRAAVQPASDYVNSKNYTTLFGDGGANDVRLVLRDLGFAQAEVERLRAERDSLRAAVQRVRAMAEDWGQRANSGVITGDYGHDTATASAYYHGSGDLLLALDGPTEDTEPSDRGSS